jgi:acyl-CoA synthetase (AMP-forming)/AMP-acid ligase II
VKVLKRGTYLEQKILRTGDLFKMDEEKYLYFVARKDDLIKTGGELVSPKEIENILYELSEVNEAAVFGVEHEILGQAIKASLVLEEDSELTEKDIIDHCSLHLEKYMIPKYVDIRTEFPKTLTGKVSYKNIQYCNK